MSKDRDIAMKPTWRLGVAFCNICGKPLPPRGKVKVCNFCPVCGQAVNWKK